MNTELTIIIPTYNRKERLLNQLRSIYVQPSSSNVEIVILDNCSNYNVKKTIESTFGKEQTKNLEVISHPYNIGLALNIAMPFYYCKTNWLWIISDDDETLPHSIETILNDIKNYPDISVLKYSLKGHSQHNNTEIKDLEELTNYYKQPNHSQGEFIFISNGVFNIRKLTPILGDVIAYAYCAVAGILPMVFSLDKGIGNVLMRSEEIVIYKAPEKGTEWNYYKITISLVGILDYPYQMSGKQMLKLMKCFDHFSFFSFINSLFQLNDKEKTKIYFDKVYNVIFKNKNIVKRLFYNIIFFLYYYLNINTMHIINYLKSNLKKIRLQ